MLQRHEVKHYMISLNTVKYHYTDEELQRRIKFAEDLCSLYGYLSYKQIVDVMKNY